MKKTLTVNLGGTVYYIDIDAFHLLDTYLQNLKAHFGRETGGDEIVDDIERRVSELFAQRVEGGERVITLGMVEEVIRCLGRPEEMEDDGDDDYHTASIYTDAEASPRADATDGDTLTGASPAGDTAADSTNANTTSNSGGGTSTIADGTAPKAHRKLFRNPDDRILGGVIGGLACYLGWNATLLRLLLVVILIAGHGILVPVYLVCWLIIPLAHTAAQKLSMQGKPVTMESIGQSVTGCLADKKTRTTLQKIGDGLTAVIGWILKACLVLLVVLCCPLLLGLGIVFVVLLCSVIALAVGGGATLFSLIPLPFHLFSLAAAPAIILVTAAILIVAIPLIGLVWAILSRLFRWRPVATWLKWAMVILWLVAIIVFGTCVMLHADLFSTLHKYVTGGGWPLGRFF
ncbi:MAG: PspC domain-containing protein [Prevotellaceae bacterium]|nr:PspC domain-containing protein [Prevotellaceae bacterium]